MTAVSESTAIREGGAVVEIADSRARRWDIGWAESSRSNRQRPNGQRRDGSPWKRRDRSATLARARAGWGGGGGRRLTMTTACTHAMIHGAAAWAGTVATAHAAGQESVPARDPAGQIPAGPRVGLSRTQAAVQAVSTAGSFCRGLGGGGADPIRHRAVTTARVLEMVLAVRDESGGCCGWLGDLGKRGLGARAWARCGRDGVRIACASMRLRSRFRAERR